jgi:serine/threonine protein kinase
MSLDTCPQTSLDKSQKFRDTFKYVKDIGQGSFGIVKLLYHIKSKRHVAVKIVKLDGVDAEISFQNKLKTHPNIIRLYCYYTKNENAYIFMEYAEHGDLLSLLRTNKTQTISELHAKSIFLQLLNAVSYCHENNIFHRDIKLENILLNDTIVKLADFGYSCPLDNIPYGPIVGTPAYIAPEIIKNEKYDGIKADIWACGIVLYVLVCGKYPFEYNLPYDPIKADIHTFSELFGKILKGKYNVPSHISPELKDLLQRIFTIDPVKRITIPEIWDSEWMNIDLKNII